MARSAKLKRVYLFGCGHFTAPDPDKDGFRYVDDRQLCWGCKAKSRDPKHYPALCPDFDLAWAWEDQAE